MCFKCSFCMVSCVVGANLRWKKNDYKAIDVEKLPNIRKIEKENVFISHAIHTMQTNIIIINIFRIRSFIYISLPCCKLYANNAEFIEVFDDEKLLLNLFFSSKHISMFSLFLHLDVEHVNVVFFLFSIAISNLNVKSVVRL